jgi:CRISPR-associated protein Cas2
MSYYVATYDVNASRVARYLKLFRQYLHWVQNSVFEGELTEAQLQALSVGVKALLEDNDSVLLFRVGTASPDRITLGRRCAPSRFL